MSEVFVKEGDILKQGDMIGSVGSTGRVTGPHLHWSVYLNKVRVNPESLLKEGYLSFLLESAQNSI
jgi:murein DD-endopeptidase MepM/ murein hydrolase activator NlpD